MKVKVNTKVRDKVMKSLTGERFTSRTFSVTKLTCCPRKTFYSMSGVRAVISEASTLFMARGRGLHYELQKGFKDTEVRKEMDVIRGDIDAVDERITEMYSTNMSLSKVVDETKVPSVFPAKIKQLMAYCFMSGVNTGDLLVFFMSGDYSRFTDIFGEKVYTGIQPEIRVWTLEFTEEELKENWKKILDNKAEIELALKTGNPPLVCGEEFECKNCGFNYTCLGEEEEFECKNCGFNYTCLGEEPVTEPVEELK